MFYVLERFEGDYAILISDEKQSISVLKSTLKNAKISDAFTLGESGKYIFDEKETLERKNRVLSLHRSVFSKAKK